MGYKDSIYRLSYPPFIAYFTCLQKVTNLKTCKVCNEGMVEDECHLLFTCSIYTAICSRYVDILRASDNLIATLKTPPRRLSSYVYALFIHRDFVLQCINTPSQEGVTYQEHMYTLVPQVKIGLFMDDKKKFLILMGHSYKMVKQRRTIKVKSQVGSCFH